MVKMHCIGAFGMLIRSVFRLHLPRSMNHNVVRTLTDWCQAKLQGLQQHLAFLICHDGLLDLLLQLPVTFDAVLAWCYNKMTHVFFFSSGISDLAQGWSRMHFSFFRQIWPCTACSCMARMFTSAVEYQCLCASLTPLLAIQNSKVVQLQSHKITTS